MSKLNSKGEITPPCSTLFNMENFADVSSLHFTHFTLLKAYFSKYEDSLHVLGQKYMDE